MHMLGDPRTMQHDPRYDDVVAEVKAFLEERLDFAIAHGIAEERILLDPGIGFGKTVEHNLELLRRLDELVAIGRPIVIGTSRKCFLGRLTGRDVDDRVAGDDRHQRARVRARGAGVPRPRRRAGARRAHGGGCYGHRAMDDDADEYDDVDDEDEGDEHPEPEVTIEISGLSLFTHVGVTAAEREVGQRLLLDLRLDVGECDATITDRIEDTVDYAEVCDAANLVAQQRTYKTLERLCTAVADRLLEHYEAHAVWVKAAKPEPPMALPVSEVSVEVWREARVTPGLSRPGVESRRPAGAPPGGRRRRCRRTASSVLASSSVYETEPVGLVLDQREFFNACLRSRPQHGPDELLAACKAVERELGREPGGVRHGPRVIDVDVLLLDELSTVRAADAPPSRGHHAAVRAGAAARARPRPGAPRRTAACGRARRARRTGRRSAASGEPLL